MNMDRLNQVSEFRCCQQNNLKFSEDVMKFHRFDFIISLIQNSLNVTVEYCLAKKYFVLCLLD